MRNPEAQPPGSDPELEARLVELLPTGSPPERARGRLLAAAQSWPLRYAPFYDQLGALWDLADPELEAVFTLAASERSWRRVWPGFRFLGVAGGPKLEGGRARLLHFAPGVRFPRHRHRGSERILVLEGSYTDSNLVRVGPGDEQDMAPGSEHELVIGLEGPCVAGVVERGLEFSGPVLGLLSRWFSR